MLALYSASCAAATADLPPGQQPPQAQAAPVSQEIPFPKAPPDPGVVADAKRRAVAELVAKAGGDRFVPVIVGFEVAGGATPAGGVDRGQAIAIARESILEQLRPGSVEGVKRYATIPYFAARVTADALDVLEHLGSVISIAEDVPVAPAAPSGWGRESIGGAMAAGNEPAAPASLAWVVVRQPQRQGGPAANCLVGPGPPAELKVARSAGGHLRLEWAASGGGATTYWLEVGSAPGLADGLVTNLRNASTLFEASGVGPGTYYLRVKGANACGASGPSNEVILIVP
ncbi:MAG: fibronectin type III domain-containing protein [Acidobacteria bacterium]|nr:fibronectin type III domain-containing protein [Acidobacteriota bacterium]